MQKKEKSKELALSLTPEQEAQLRADFPVDASFTRALLPRFGLVSQDKTEKVGKSVTLVASAGDYFIERQDEEVNPDTGKKEWTKEELGTSVEGIIIFQRKQLRFYDEGEQKYTSSPIYDSNDEVVPLFKDKVKVATDTPDNLKKMYPGISRAGKPVSKLNEDRILYVLINGEIFQWNLHGTSMYAFLDYSRKVTVPAVVTSFGSEAKESGATNWNQATFTMLRKITPAEFEEVSAAQAQIKEGIAAEKAFFAGAKVDSVARQIISEADKEYAKLGESTNSKMKF